MFDAELETKKVIAFIQNYYQNDINCSAKMLFYIEFLIEHQESVYKHKNRNAFTKKTQAILYCRLPGCRGNKIGMPSSVVQSNNHKNCNYFYKIYI